MKPSTPIHAAVFAALAACNAYANDESSSASAEEDASGWGLGLAAIASDNPYAGRGVRYLPVPLVSYEGERFFFQGATLGAHLLETQSLQLDLVVEAAMDGVDADDFGARELAENGVNRALLSDRKDSADAGFDLSFGGRFGQVKIEALTDVLDASGGQQVTASYGYPFVFGERLVLTPTIGAKWLSEDRANYYFGILDEEVARGVADYRPGSVVIPEVGIDVQYRLGERWVLMAGVNFQPLPNKIQDSPLLESGQSFGVLVGVLRSF